MNENDAAHNHLSVAGPSYAKDWLRQDLQPKMDMTYKSGDDWIVMCPMDDRKVHLDSHGSVEPECECDPAEVEAVLTRWAREMPDKCREVGYHRGCQRCATYDAKLRQLTREAAQRKSPDALFEDRLAWHDADRKARRTLDIREEEEQLAAVAASWLSLDEAIDVPEVTAIWGPANAPYTSEGQPWMIAARDGRGKTTLALQYVRARLGLPDWTGDVLGQPVKPLEDGMSVLYYAMDRPHQIRERLRDGMSQAAVEAGRGRLQLFPGPPPYRLDTHEGQERMVTEALERNAGLIVLDSRKDLGDVLDSRSVTGIARCISLLAARGIEVLILHHVNKGSAVSLEAVAGFKEVYSNLGSVLILDAPKAGASVITVHHVKPIKRPRPKLVAQVDFMGGQLMLDTVLEEHDDETSVTIDGSVLAEQEDRMLVLLKERRTEPDQRLTNKLTGAGGYHAAGKATLDRMRTDGIVDYLPSKGRNGKGQEWFLIEWDEYDGQGERFRVQSSSGVDN